jgi:hypothetical protein
VRFECSGARIDGMNIMLGIDWEASECLIDHVGWTESSGEIPKLSDVELETPEEQSPVSFVEVRDQRAVYCCEVAFGAGFDDDIR